MIHFIKSLIRKIRRKLGPVLVLVQLMPYLFQVRNDVELQLVFSSYIAWMPLCIFSDPVQWIQLIVTSSNRFRLAYQRPHSFYAPHLKSLPFNPADSVSQRLEEHWEMILQEFYQVELLEISTLSTSLIDQRMWNTFSLMRAAQEIPENTARCPQTWAVVNQCPLMHGVRGGVYFSIIYPGTHIDSHCGPSNLKLRYHLTIEEAEGVKIRSADTWQT